MTMTLDTNLILTVTPNIDTPETPEPMITCAYCGHKHPESEMEQYGPNNEYFCPDCIDEMGICEDCGSVHHCEEMFYVHNTDRDDDRYYVCEGCLDAHYERCDECGEYFRSREMETHGGCTYCPTCYEENFMECPECGDMEARL